jgi:hypothetical protein
MSETTRARKPHTRALIVSMTVLLGGIAVSLAGNVQAINLDRPAGIGETLSALVWPLFLFWAIEVMLHTPWVRSWRDGLTKWVGLAGAAFIALYVSYGHLEHVLDAYGYDSVASHVGPLAVDVTMAMATLSLNRVGQSRRAHLATLDTPDLSKPTTYVASEEDARVSADIMANPMSYVGPFVAPSPSSADGLAQDESVWQSLVSRLDVQDEPSLAAPVSPAPAGSNRVRPSSVPDQAVVLLMAWYTADATTRPTPGDVDRLVAADLDVSTRTARRYREALAV